MDSLKPQKEWMPESIGNYKITGRLGRGGMGDIYKAQQASLDRTVALKVLSPQMGRSEEFSKRFEIEAKAISMLQHHNIVSIYEYGEELGMKYFAMQFVDGMDLGKRIAKKGEMSFDEIIDIAKQICRALRYAHSQSVIHRDIKPQNVLIEKGGVCRLSDFGIARIFQQDNLTMTGMAVGTPEYMSPEQAEGLDLDNQTDIYSLGVVIYEMLTQRPPFSGNNPVAIAYKQVHELPLPPSAFRKDTPKRLELIVLKALKKNKMDRYSSIENMLKDLDTVDLDDAAVKATVSIPQAKKGPSKDNRRHDTANRRITDRRSGGRRKGSAQLPEGFNLIKYLEESVKKQALSLVLIGLLTLLLIAHILGTTP